jgi:hypothetical protein
VYREWKIQEAVGGVRLNTQSETADLQNVQLTQGQSKILLSGSAALSGSPIDLHVESNRVAAADIQQFLPQRIDGILSGKLHVTSVSPALRVEGDVAAKDLIVEQRVIGDASGYVRYFEPVIQVDRFSLKRNNARVTGNMTFNKSTDALSFIARLNSVDLADFHEYGLPKSLTGVITQADVQADGTRARPNVRGDATIQNLSVYDETFPQARIHVSSSGIKADLQIAAARNLDLTAQVDLGTRGYPFTGRATFTQYRLERIVGLQEGSVTATGNATLSGDVVRTGHGCHKLARPRSD